MVNTFMTTDLIPTLKTTASLCLQGATVFYILDNFINSNFLGLSVANKQRKLHGKSLVDFLMFCLFREIFQNETLKLSV